jgi:predicted nucleic acid-binding protein
MFIRLAHVQDDPGSECSGQRASHPEGAGSPGRDVPFGFPVGRDASCCGATQCCGTPGTVAPALSCCRPGVSGGSRAPRAGCTVIVLDASAAIEWLLQSPSGVKIEHRIFAPSESLHAPHLLDVEVAQVMRRYVRDKTIAAQRAQEALEDLGDLRLRRYPHDFLIPRIWELRATLTAYDAAYVTLAELLTAPLLTCDARIASAPGHDAKVEVL